MSEIEKLLCQAIVELSYCHSAEDLSQVESSAGLNIIEEGIKILNLKDLSEEETDKYLRPRAYAADLQARLSRGERGIPKIPDSPDTRHAQAQPPTEQFVIVTHGDGAEAFIVNSREEMEQAFIGLFNDPADPDDEETKHWLSELRNPDNWSTDYPDYLPLCYKADLEDGGIQVIRLSRLSNPAARPAEQPAPPPKRMMSYSGGEPHEESPDCRGLCDEVPAAQPSAPPQPARPSVADKNDAREHISAERFLAIEGFADSRAHSSTAIAELMERYAASVTQERDALRRALLEDVLPFVSGMSGWDKARNLEAQILDVTRAAAEESQPK